MKYNPVEIIKKKRNGFCLAEEEIDFFISGYIKKEIPDYQMSALLMAIYFSDLVDDEILALTNSYINSGDKVDLSKLNKPKADKHSTGGVGDKTSIILAPLLACFDVVVPMMSGRGLGHTGGTLDKLESIPGFNINLTKDAFISQLEKINVCMIGQTDNLTPADKYIYALRDVTATVENTGLITASITSKKIASGADCIVYDVKVGSGSTLRDIHHSRQLAEKLLDITRKFNRRAMALLTDMNEPLGKSVGNWFEIEECLEILNPEKNPDKLSNDLREITLSLAGAMLVLTGKCENQEQGYALAEEKLNSGEPLKKFIEMAQMQGADNQYLLKPDTYPKAKYSTEIKSNSDGYISVMNAMNFGLASVELGCGRKMLNDMIDYSSGILLKKKCGDVVRKGEVICILYAEVENALNTASHIIENSIEISKNNIPKQKSKIIEVIN